MSKQSPAGPHARIDAAEVTGVELTDDRRRLRLRLVDEAGRPASVSLPVASLNEVLAAVLRGGKEPSTQAPGSIHTLDSWSLRQGEHGLLLTLHVPDGGRVTFAVQPWQIAAIASLAGQGDGPRSVRLN